MKAGNRKENRIIIRARKRRMMQRYRNTARFVLALFIVTTLATMTLTIRSFARDRQSEEPRFKYYTSYTVQPGESLSRIAERYITDEYSSMDKYLSEVASINHLVSASRIDDGQILILPYYSSDIR